MCVCVCVRDVYLLTKKKKTENENKINGYQHKQTNIKRFQFPSTTAKSRPLWMHLKHFQWCQKTLIKFFFLWSTQFIWWQWYFVSIMTKSMTKCQWKREREKDYDDNDNSHYHYHYFFLSIDFCFSIFRWQQ